MLSVSAYLWLQRHVALNTWTEVNCVVVAVEDDGRSFDLEGAHGRGRGLSNVRWRADAIGRDQDSSDTEHLPTIYVGAVMKATPGSS